MNIRNIQTVRNIYFRYINYLQKFSYTKGTGNKFMRKGSKISSRVHILGNRNCISLEEGSLLKKSLIHIQGSNNRIFIGKSAIVSGVELWIEDDNCSIIIGERTFIGEGGALSCVENGRSIIIGKDCMISAHVQIRTSDSHSILDEKGNRINTASDVTINDHVWVGDGARILKGSFINENCVVSTGAIVTKPFEQNTLIGGIPAKIIKENITWDSKRL